MSERYGVCPICDNVLKEHTVQNFIDCITESSHMRPQFVKSEHASAISFGRRALAKNHDALDVINGLLESPHLSNFGNTMNYEDLLKKLKDLLS